MTETLLYIILGISLISLLFSLFVYFKKSKGEINTSNIETTLKDSVNNLQRTMSEDMFKSMMKFNNDLNEQLLNINKKSGDNITEFRINVNKELVAFQEKIATKLNTDFKALTDAIDGKMNTINSKVEERLAKGFRDTNQTFVQIAERVKVIDDAQKKIETLSEEMIGLQNILSNNQARGTFGEYQLNQLLYSVFGENSKLYKTQYTIEKDNQEIVRADAVIFMPKPNKMIAIDSKFPYSSYSKLFENNKLSDVEEAKIISDFGREVRKHITDISKKYIVPGVTADYAFMFVPSDGILALLHSKLINVVEYARDKDITIVSPTTILPLLSSFRAVIIDYEQSKHTREIITQLKKLKKDFEIFDKEWTKLNNSIDTLKSDSNKVNKRVSKITDKFSRISHAEGISEQDDVLLEDGEDENNSVD